MRKPIKKASQATGKIAAAAASLINESGPKPKLIVVLGPTAIGKSDLAVTLAKELGGEVISADSRQVYKGLDIGSGKITKKEMQGVPHHCIDVISPKRKYTVSMFQEDASSAIDSILKKGKVPILCGGTGFYIDSVVNGTVLPDVQVNPILRKKLEKYPDEKLRATLAKIDPERLAAIHPNNRIRIIRAIEIATELGKVPAVQKIHKYDTLFIGLDTDDATLREKILKRIHARIKKGMIKEAERLHEEGVSWKRMKELGLEYGLLADHLRGKLSKEELVERLNFDIVHYVRRQRQWFRYNKEVRWFDPTKSEEAEKILRAAQSFLIKA